MINWTIVKHGSSKTTVDVRDIPRRIKWTPFCEHVGIMNSIEVYPTDSKIKRTKKLHQETWNFKWHRSKQEFNKVDAVLSRQLLVGRLTPVNPPFVTPCLLATIGVSDICHLESTQIGASVYAPWSNLILRTTKRLLCCWLAVNKIDLHSTIEQPKTSGRSVKSVPQ